MMSASCVDRPRILRGVVVLVLRCAICRRRPDYIAILICRSPSLIGRPYQLTWSEVSTEIQSTISRLVTTVPRGIRTADRLIFATLGPAGSNHKYVTERYLALHGLEDLEIRLVDDFVTGIAMMSTGEVDYILQVAVHPDTMDTVARAHFEHGIYVTDAFVSPNRPLAVPTRVEVQRPASLGLQPAAAVYLDTSCWAK